MGISFARTDLAGALFTPVQQRVLALLYGQPERRFQSAELIRLAESGTGAVHRLLRRLESSGLIVATRVGNQKHYQANRSSPIFAELHGLVVKTIGIAEPLRKSLMPIAKRIHAAFVYGSIAKGAARANSDVDVMVISDRMSSAELENLAKIGQVKREAPNAAEIAGLVHSGDARLTDASLGVGCLTSPQALPRSA